MKNNPFVLPGFGQTGPLSENPILASMEMMRQAWEGLASSGNVDATAMGKLMSVEEMDKRISDLRAVENWLNMNLTMLRSTIQGLEVQRATLATLKSFMEGGMGSAAHAAHAAQSATEPGATRGRSPVDEVLKSWPGPKQTEDPAQPQSQAPSQGRTETDDDSAADAQSGTRPETSPQQDDVLAAAATAAQGWWNVMQQQFQTLAAATAASAEGTMAEMQEAAARTGRQAAGQATGSGKPAKKAAGAKTAAKKAAKTSKAAKSAGTTRASRSTTAAKKASKTSTPRKTTR